MHRSDNPNSLSMPATFVDRHLYIFLPLLSKMQHLLSILVPQVSRVSVFIYQSPSVYRNFGLREFVAGKGMPKHKKKPHVLRSTSTRWVFKFDTAHSHSIGSLSTNYPLRNWHFPTCWGSHMCPLCPYIFPLWLVEHLIFWKEKCWIPHMDFQCLAGGRYLGLQRFRGAQRCLRPWDSDLSAGGKAGVGGIAADGCA